MFCGIDTSICVETSLREAFNIGYDVILVSDSTASGNKRHYETTLERVRDYYGLVLDTKRFYKLINSLEDLKLGKMDHNELNEKYDKFLKEFRLIDIRRN
ncbi:hypothetical protein BH23THE1_BH23THE1_15540 [soil metagenome]